MSETLIGYARCSTDTQDLTAQRERLRELGVADERIYLDHGLTGTNRKRPGLDQLRRISGAREHRDDSRHHHRDDEDDTPAAFVVGHHQDAGDQRNDSDEAGHGHVDRATPERRIRHMSRLIPHSDYLSCKSRASDRRAGDGQL
jgi:hypothetical protein